MKKHEISAMIPPIITNAMAFTVNDLQDLTRLLATHPEWLSEVRRLVLTDELLSLPDIMRNLAQRVDQLAEAQRRTEERLEQLTVRMDQLTARMDQLAKTTHQLVNQMAEVRGDALEIKFRDKAPSYFGRWLRRLRVVSVTDIEELFDPALTDQDMCELLPLDLLVRGRPRLPSESADEIWLAVEISSVIDANDVRRAERRAALLRQAGLKAVPVAAGATINPEAQSLAASLHVAVLQDGTDEGWEAAYQAAVGH